MLGHPRCGEFHLCLNLSLEIRHRLPENHRDHQYLLQMNQTRATWGERCYLPNGKLTVPVILAATASCLATATFYVVLQLAQHPKDTELARGG